jgi:L-lactate dehydrogenase
MRHSSVWRQIHWSGITVACTPFKLLHDADPSFRSEIEKYTAGAAASIIEAKGCTNFGIGNIAASLCKYILSDQRTIRPVSYFQEDLGVTLSMPAVIGRKGIVRPIKVELDEDEKSRLEKSAKALRDIQDKAQKELDKVVKEAESKWCHKNGHEGQK